MQTAFDRRVLTEGTSSHLQDDNSNHSSDEIDTDQLRHILRDPKMAALFGISMLSQIYAV